MVFHAKNGVLTLDNSRMDYVRFGTGKRNLILLPGLGDGLTTVKGTALPMALTYRLFARDFTVYMFSRKEPLSTGCTTEDMARDQVQAMDLLGIDQADVLGVSMGGMIAQQIAALYPQRVGKLVLAVTCARANDLLKQSVKLWTDLASRGDHTGLMDNNVRLIYSEDYYRKNKWLVPLMGKLTKPRSYDRFLIQAAACSGHDCFQRLGDIRCPTLIIGGEKDAVIGSQPSRELAEHIPGSRLRIYPQWGHGVYEEEKTFNRTVLEFLLEEETLCMK